tara:strand:- start:1010 stop:1690 length:681 start_codon:yes stop_codon:yes gene_type:complete
MRQLIDKKYKITGYLVLLLILSTTSGKFIESKNNYSSLNKTKVDVRGLSSKENLEILKKLDKVLSQSIFNIDEEEIKKILERQNIIEEYEVKKIYPSTIKINIKPTKFIARISDQHQLLVGSNGKIIKKQKYEKDLPYIFGEFKTKDFLIFKKNVELSSFNFSEFKMLYFFPLNRWDILTTDGVLIKLPKENLIKSLDLAHKIISKDFLRNKNFIDLRVSNQLIIK